METLTMSGKERERLTIMAGVTGRRTDAGAGGRADGGGLPAEQAHLAAVSGRRGRGAGASAAGQTQRAAQAARHCGRRCWLDMRRNATPDFGPTLMAEHLAKEKLVVDHETVRRWRLAEGEHNVAAAQATAPAMAGAQALFWGDGATGRIAPRLVRGAAVPGAC